MHIKEILAEKNADYSSNSIPTIVFLGDSVTHGCFEVIEGNNKPLEVICDFEAVYHNQLKKLLNTVFPFTPINIINAGISGDTATGGLQRLDRDVLKFNPHLVVICYGLNDSNRCREKLQEYRNSLLGIFSKLKANNTEIVFMTPNMKNTYISPLIKNPLLKEMARINMETQLDGTFDEYIDCAREICGKEEVILCDCYSKWQKMYQDNIDTTVLLSNLINHPTREMHKLFAWSLFELIVFSDNK